MIICNKVNIDLINKYQVITQSGAFPWFYQDKIVDIDKGNPGFTHSVYKNTTGINSSCYDDTLYLLNTICNINNISYQKVIRLQYNLTTNIINNNNHNIHKDVDNDNCLSILYYVNNADGNTIIYDKDKTYTINPEAGKYVIFKSNTDHEGCLPKEFSNRIVLNMIIERDNG